MEYRFSLQFMKGDNCLFLSSFLANLSVFLYLETQVGVLQAFTFT